ncbi:RNA-binding protein 25-like, partial [Trifolium medium]|nr:RNA-binding protein 25-like [Trifolium medium]
SHGYIHNVDQLSISFFFTNFPDNCTTEELWKRFARFGRVGDVFIPKKVDKWGRRFGFVKYREVKEEKKRSVSPTLIIPREEGEASVQPGRSFKKALVNSTGVNEVREKVAGESFEPLKVEVDPA